MKKLLVVVDMQNDFVNGALGSEEAIKILPAVKALIAREQAAGTEIVFTMDTHGENYLTTAEGKHLPVPHCIKGTAGWEIIPELSVYAERARRFEKPVFGSIELAEYARQNNYDEIVLCGVCTDICVLSNAILLKAYCPETPITVYEKACAGTSPAAHDASLVAMRSCHITVV